MTLPTEKHSVTQVEGYSYIGKFFFPCNTSHLKMKKVKSVLLVASLEVPVVQDWTRCGGREEGDV